MAKQQDHRAHQAKLAASGYRLPATMYVEPPGAGEQSIEQQSGDGGKAAAAAEQTSPHGYQGTLRTRAEVQAAADASKTVDPKTGLTIPGAVERQAAALYAPAPVETPDDLEDADDDDAPKGGAGPAENKSAKPSRRKR